jgi:hypothetical protein
MEIPSKYCKSKRPKGLKIIKNKNNITAKAAIFMKYSLWPLPTKTRELRWSYCCSRGRERLAAAADYVTITSLHNRGRSKHSDYRTVSPYWQSFLDPAISSDSDSD